MRLFTQFIDRLRQFSGKLWYLPLLAFLAASDLFVAFIPTDALVISTVLISRERWRRTAFWIAFGSACGALTLGIVARLYGTPFIHWMSPGLLASPQWTQASGYITAYGPVGLLAISASPLPQQPAVLLCGLARMPLGIIFTTVLISRALKYGFLAWSASRAPGLFHRSRVP